MSLSISNAVTSSRLLRVLLPNWLFFSLGILVSESFIYMGKYYVPIFASLLNSDFYNLFESVFHL